jgi:hypothetical protein
VPNPQRRKSRVLIVMNRTFPKTLKYVGVPIVVAAWILAGRLVWEQTVWSWTRGPQMVGFSLMHSGQATILLLALFAGAIWTVVVVAAAAWTRSFGGKLVIWLLLAYAIACGLIAVPYGFWQRFFIQQFPAEKSIDFFTQAAATGDLRTVKAFLDHGLDVNAQNSSGTALHGAAVGGEAEVIEFLIAHGADVNAINAYGDSPLANAMEAVERATETQAVLTRHGAKLIRGTAEQRARAIEEQVRKDMEKMDRLIPRDQTE